MSWPQPTTSKRDALTESDQSAYSAARQPHSHHAPRRCARAAGGGCNVDIATAPLPRSSPPRSPHAPLLRPSPPPLSAAHPRPRGSLGWPPRSSPAAPHTAEGARTGGRAKRALRAASAADTSGSSSLARSSSATSWASSPPAGRRARHASTSCSAREPAYVTSSARTMAMCAQRSRISESHS
eukprot:5032603-Prymnesium_polylepis.1